MTVAEVAAAVMGVAMMTEAPAAGVGMGVREVEAMEVAVTLAEINPTKHQGPILAQPGEFWRSRVKLTRNP